MFYSTTAPCKIEALSLELLSSVTQLQQRVKEWPHNSPDLNILYPDDQTLSLKVGDVAKRETEHKSPNCWGSALTTRLMYKRGCYVQPLLEKEVVALYFAGKLNNFPIPLLWTAFKHSLCNDIEHCPWLNLQLNPVQHHINCTCNFCSTDKT